MFDLYPSGEPRLTIHLLPRDEGLTVHAESADGDSITAGTMLQRIEDVLRMASQPGFHEDVGRGLFRSLLPGELDELYRATYAQATIDGARLALDLHIDRSLVRLARYPWELLHDGSRFLLRTGKVSLTRTLDFPAPVGAYEPRGPLEILTAAPQPRDQSPLAAMGEMLPDMLADSIRADTVDVAQLFPATWDALLEWLLAGGPDVLHFEGHGDFTRTGRLYFEDVHGAVDPVEAGDIGAALYSTALRMVVLNASTASGVLDETALSSIAPTLIEAGIPAVIAAQYTLPKAEAARFWRVVYSALLAGHDVESAVVAGRHALRRSMYWHAIALYRRAAHMPAPDSVPVPVRAETAAPVAAQLGWTVRAGVWLRAADAPPPDSGAVERVIGVPPAQGAGGPQSSTRPAPETLDVAVRPGVVTVQLDAPGCAVHNQSERTLIFAGDGPSLPLWFAVTPRREGDVTLTFTLAQDGHTLATLAHPLRVDGLGAGPVASDTALLHTHGTTGERAAPVGRALARDSREPSADSASDAGEVERESREAQAWDAPRRDALFSETLDGVQDTLQTGQPPDDDDDPLVRTPVPRIRRIAPQPEDAVPFAPDVAVPPEESTRLGDMPPPERIIDDEDVAIDDEGVAVDDYGAAALDALPETESLRALSSRRPQPSRHVAPVEAVESGSPPAPQAPATFVPPFIDPDAESAAAAEKGARRWSLQAIVMVVLIVLVVIVIALVLLS